MYKSRSVASHRKSNKSKPSQRTKRNFAKRSTDHPEVKLSTNQPQRVPPRPSVPVLPTIEESANMVKGYFSSQNYNDNVAIRRRKRQEEGTSRAGNEDDTTTVRDVVQKVQDANQVNFLSPQLTDNQMNKTTRNDKMNPYQRATMCATPEEHMAISEALAQQSYEFDNSVIQPMVNSAKELHVPFKNINNELAASCPPRPKRNTTTTSNATTNTTHEHDPNPPTPTMATSPTNIGGRRTFATKGNNQPVTNANVTNNNQNSNASVAHQLHYRQSEPLSESGFENYSGGMTFDPNVYLGASTTNSNSFVKNQFKVATPTGSKKTSPITTSTAHRTFASNDNNKGVLGQAMAVGKTVSNGINFITSLADEAKKNAKKTGANVDPVNSRTTANTTKTTSVDSDSYIPANPLVGAVHSMRDVGRKSAKVGEVVDNVFQGKTVSKDDFSHVISDTKDIAHSMSNAYENIKPVVKSTVAAAVAEADAQANRTTSNSNTTQRTSTNINNPTSSSSTTKM